MTHRWGPREERAVPWSVLPVGQYRCQRPGCNCVRTSEPYHDKNGAERRRTVYIFGRSLTVFIGKAPACQGGNDGTHAKEQGTG